jgi:F0F1-type ATP synthase membrane subunit b/b'
VERATSQAQRMEATAKRLASQRAEDARVRASQNPVR